MDSFLLGVNIGLAVLGVLALIIGPIALIYYLASKNIFFTLVEYETAKAIKRYGHFKRLVASLGDGRYFDVKWNVITTGAAGGTRRRHGLRWVGIPFVDQVHRYNLRYVAMEQTEKDGKLVNQVVPYCREETDFISLKDTVIYGLIDNAETNDFVPVEAGLLLTIRIVNPHDAFFRVEDWIKATLNLVKPPMRTFISQRTFKKLITKKEDIGNAPSKFLQDSDVDENLKEHYGVELVDAEFAFINPTGEHGKIITQSATKKWEAERDAERIGIAARAEEGRVNRVYGSVINKGAEGLFIRATEALEKAGAGQGNTVVFPLGMIEELMKAWTGRTRGRTRT